MGQVRSYYRGKDLKRIQTNTFVDLFIDVKFPHFAEEIGLVVEDNIWRGICFAEFPELEWLPADGGLGL